MLEKNYLIEKIFYNFTRLSYCYEVAENHDRPRSEYTQHMKKENAGVMAQS